jgi:hypothetical protein
MGHAKTRAAQKIDRPNVSLDRHQLKDNFRAHDFERYEQATPGFATWGSFTYPGLLGDLASEGTELSRNDALN